MDFFRAICWLVLAFLAATLIVAALSLSGCTPVSAAHDGPSAALFPAPAHD